MKIITKYMCEICKAEFQTEDDAKRCEGNHIAKGTISGMKFVAGTKYPRAIQMTFADGGKALYVEYKKPEVTEGR